MSGCAANQAARLQERAGDTQGRIQAGVTIERQPDECQSKWPLLDRGQVVGSEALTVIDRYETYIEGTINPAKARCWLFNENIRAGLSRSGN